MKFELPIPKSLLHAHEGLKSLLERRLWLQVIAGLILGIATGVLLGPDCDLIPRHYAEQITGWLALPGHLFIALIQMIVMPLVFSSVIRGVAGSGTFEQIKSLGGRLLLYFIATTSVAVMIGLLISNLLAPGHFIDTEMLRQDADSPISSDVGIPSFSWQDRIGALIPTNPLKAIVSDQMLEVVIFSVIFGVALLSLEKQKSKPLLDILDSVLLACLSIVNWTMRLAPFAVYGLLTQVTSRLGFEVLTGLGLYMLTVIIGLLGVLIFYATLVAVFGRIHPFYFFSSIKDALLLAFSTSSSAAVMPVSLATAQGALKVRPEVAQVVVPLGTTINMDGTALYQGVATVFLAQAYGIELGVGSLMLVVVTAIGASIGSPGTPGVGIIILSSILAGVGVPAAGVALIVGVDRILDMCRTSVNVAGDLTASVVMNRVLKPVVLSSSKRIRQE